MSTKQNNSASILAPLVTGLAAGVIIGILYAPEKGAETRKKIKTKANDLKDQATNKYLAVSDTVKDQYDTISSTFTNVGNSVKDNFDKYKDQIVSTTTEVIKDVEMKLNELK
ncbi:YtxH domain-containing protein [Chryseobacterium mulctrae]|uniref:YtxH domain-containing protein n=1 Tax=Chryseobacterium mulctrae TaxID=2576777 RepID=UPI0011162F12|nr:YtxH domain-containing protein [Chryseobacterium mulctrae]